MLTGYSQVRICGRLAILDCIQCCLSYRYFASNLLLLLSWLTELIMGKWVLEMDMSEYFINISIACYLKTDKLFDALCPMKLNLKI